ncbi:MAG: hypothetical protein IH991_22200, partial [Planctomycetes bacterium]|nr:hypothetical protein [Planctomycetota bacterium]
MQRLLLCFCASVVFATAHAASAQISGEAVLGTPFGVGRIKVLLTPQDASLIQSRGYLLTEQNGRVFYPSFDQSGEGVLGFLNDVIENNAEPATWLDVRFLFSGEQPLKLTLHT